MSGSCGKVLHVPDPSNYTIHLKINNFFLKYIFQVLEQLQVTFLRSRFSWLVQSTAMMVMSRAAGAGLGVRAEVVFLQSSHW